MCSLLNNMVVFRTSATNYYCEFGVLYTEVLLNINWFMLVVNPYLRMYVRKKHFAITYDMNISLWSTNICNAATLKNNNTSHQIYST